MYLDVLYAYDDVSRRLLFFRVNIPSYEEFNLVSVSWFLYIVNNINGGAAIPPFF